MTAEKKRMALGMGLDALLSDSLEGDYFLCPIERISPSPSQPRKAFNNDSLDELAQSIKEKGLIQPVVLRKAPSGDYELIAGERRWRAAQRAGVTELPAIVRDTLSEEVLELALVENVQRENLNPVDEARAYKLLMDSSSMTQEAVATRIGKSRVSVANSLRLLSLPQECLEALSDGLITAGHARAILSAPAADRLKLMKTIIARGLSVREAEAAANKPARKKPAPKRKDADTKALEERISRALGSRVTLKTGRKKGSGTLTINYDSLDDLDRLLSIFEDEV
ncbi:MAG: chromosome partitioning protein ParB [Deltaproteobacteria bacterium]|nr:MAG: chromosome partitioning protein ParB [Deltaproteobacteria bacterium]